MTNLDLLPYDEYVARLPRKRMSAGVLLRDARGRVLLVEPSYKPRWEIPGGVVEDGEAPWDTAVRELHEEIGLARTVGRLLVVDHVTPRNGDKLPERVAFVFDGGTIGEGEVAELVFSPEIVSARLCTPDDVRTRAESLLADRLAAAVEAAIAGQAALCERGKRVA
ncbi:MAG TPA: NUDIX hydrolase [Actinophytocola sp.]|uniref:NUDIX hydrolase n=1 Tax=Actinophytocola sp. TaxID=1872138 RepID=UPI002DDD2F53|nr:NUDIX hydrolase [Actinophytocola sp.]HEV2782362.1 NUDIX hydrolase [Actinophytocola sp.]